MHKDFSTVEDILTDEDFLSWYFKKDGGRENEWASWLTQNPGVQPLVDEAIILLKQMSIKETDMPTAKVEAALARVLDSVPNEGRLARVISMPKRSYRRMWWAAAIVLVLATGAFLWNNASSRPSLATTYGEIRQNHLPDGSIVFLNANSQVEYTDSWAEGKDREVWIKGEAFFKVAKTIQRSRFIVHTDNFDVIVTGTQFNVMNREQRTNVALTEGSVTIRTTDGREFNMKPGDFFEMNNNAVNHKTIEVENVTAWQQKKLVFNNTPLIDLAKEMEDLYGVTVKLNDAVRNSPITGMMPNDNLDILLQALEATGDFKVTKNGKEIMISLP
jgi:transmembrane sensor